MSRQQQDNEEREHELDKALNDCYRRGVSTEHLRTILFETGARWTPPQEKINAQDK